MRIDLAKIDIQRIAEAVSLAYPDDDNLLADTLEGETELYEIVGKLLGKIEDANGDVNALKEQIANRAERKGRAESRIKAIRETICQLMDVARLDKLTLPEATLSRRVVAPKTIVQNADLVPDEYCTFTRKPDMAAIKAAGEVIDGTTLDNGGVSLTVRMK